jgi:hypothetical protein
VEDLIRQELLDAPGEERFGGEAIDVEAPAFLPVRILFPHQDASVHQELHDLHGEEGIPTAGSMDHFRRLFQALGVGEPGHATQQFPDLLRAPRNQPEVPFPGTLAEGAKGSLQGGIGNPRPCGEHPQGSLCGGAARQRHEKVPAGAIHPLEIIHHDEQRPVLADRRNQFGHRMDDGRLRKAMPSVRPTPRWASALQIPMGESAPSRPERRHQ